MITETDTHSGQLLNEEIINKIISALQPAAIYQDHNLFIVALPNNSSLPPANALKLLAALPHSVYFRVYSIGDLLTEINTGSILLNHLCRRQNLIYNGNTTPLPISLQERLFDTAVRARTVFNFGKARSEAFLRGALFYLGENEINLCVFMLHQSAEMILRSIIHGLTGQDIRTHLITELNQKLTTWLPSLLPLRDNPELLQRFDASYTGVRYNRIYQTSSTDVVLLAAEVKKLLQTAERTFESIVPDQN